MMSSKLSEKDFSFSFIPYLPQDAGYKTETHLSSNLMRSNLTVINESNDVQRVELLEIMNDDLSNLLKMKFTDFISVITRNDIQKYISTFLQFSRRSTDNIFLQLNDMNNENDNKGGEGKLDMFGIDGLSQSIRRKTFLIIYRLTDTKQILLHYENNQQYGDLLYDEWIFDIPRIFDFCCIYYLSNPCITKQIVSYIFEIQPKYNHDLKHAIDLMKQKMNEICLFYHSMDPDLKLSSANQKENKNKLSANDLVNITNDINLMKELLINLYCLLQSYDGSVDFFVENDAILLLLVTIIDCTLPIIQEQLNQFQNQRLFKNSNNNNKQRQLLDANDKYNPFIVIATRLCLLISDAIINKQYKLLFDDMNQNINEHINDFELLQCQSLKLCEFLNKTTNISGYQHLHISARHFIEVGAYSRKLFGTFENLKVLMNYLLSKNIISLSDIGMVSHLIGNISQKVIDTHKNEFKSNEPDNDEKQENMNEDIAKLLQIFPDHSAKYCTELLKYFNHKFDIAVNAVLEGTVPVIIEAIDDDDLNIMANSNQNTKTKKKNNNKTKAKTKTKTRHAMDPKLEQYMEFTGRVLKKDDEEEFFDMFGNNNKNSMKKYYKKGKIYNMYDDDMDESNIQYFGFGVDDGESLSDDLEYMETQQKDKQEKEKEKNDMLNTQLNKHSYRFIPHTQENKQNNNNQNKQNNNNNNPVKRKKQEYKAPKKQSNDVRNNTNKNEYRPVSQQRPQQRPQYNQQNNNRKDNRYYKQNNNNSYDNSYDNNNNNYNQRGYDNNNNNNNNNRDNRARNNNNNYNNDNYYSGGYRGRGRGGRGGRGRGRGRGRGSGGNANKYRQQKRHATNQHRRNQAHKKYARVHQ